MSGNQFYWEKSGVYLLHFDSPYKGARHYLGFTTSYGSRMKAHRAGNGSALTKAARSVGIKWVVARVWWGASRTDEKRLRSRQENPALCPYCNPKAYNRAIEHQKDIPF